VVQSAELPSGAVGVQAPQQAGFASRLTQQQLQALSRFQLNLPLVPQRWLPARFQRPQSPAQMQADQREQ
jgi:hypothetical protein